MRAKTYVLSVVLLLAFLLFAVSCIYRRPTMRTAAILNLPQDVRLDLPGDLRHSEVDPALQKESAVIVSIPTDQQFYVGHDLTPKDQLSSKVGELLKRRGELDKAVRQPDPDKVVYLAGGVGVDYASVVDALDLIRKQDVTTIGLIGGRKHMDHDSSPASEDRSRFLVTIPAVPDPNQVMRPGRPSPLTLVVSLSRDLKFSLNNQDSPQLGEPCYGLTQTYGSVSDPQPLVKCLEFLFQRRRDLRAYRPGFETRTDLPEDDRVEKTIFVKGPRSIKYGAVIRAIDSVKGAGANPIGLQIDDLPQ